MAKPKKPGWRNLAKPSIAELKAIAFANARELFEADGRGKVFKFLPKRIRSTLVAVQLDREGRVCGFRMKDRLSALRTLGTILGMFKAR